jgi:integration host factor subunit alpha
MKVIRDNTKKKNIVKNIFLKTGLPKTYINKIIDDLNLILISNIIFKKKIKIKNFGTFLLKKKNKRFGRNPRNKSDHEISERNVVTFKVSEDFKKKLNNNV